MPETIKIFKKNAFANVYANGGHLLTCMISIMMSMILYEDYVKIMLKTLKNLQMRTWRRVPPSGGHSTYSVLRWSQVGLRCLKMAKDRPEMVKMA